MLAAKSVCANAGLDLLTPPIQSSQIVDQIVEEVSQADMPQILVAMDNERDIYEPITFSMTDSNNVNVNGFLVTHGFTVAIHDTGSARDPKRRAAWTLYHQTLMRAFYQADLVNSIKAGTLATGVAAVPELAYIDLEDREVIQPTDNKYQQIRSAFRVACVCSEQGT